ncbi:MAG: sigma-70 family RNA polymerase sigma factor [Verrucomicrobiaceae bacterium]|nr:sigma-70 family RNA polymerase sigma factor [Verrucomicrobiaceae bacterium]
MAETSPRFMTTRWTMVLQAGGEGSSREAAVEQLCQTYWYPVYAFIRRQGIKPEDAQDLTQSFFAKMLRREWLNGLEKRNVRFSTWLLIRVKTHLQNEHRDATTQKRGGEVTRVSIDLAEAENWFGNEPAGSDTPEQAFERRWALSVLEAALARVRDHCRENGKELLFEELGPFLTREPETGEYAKVAQKLEIRENTLAVTISRLRQLYREAVRDEVSVGLSDPSMVDDELRHLASCL